MYHFFVPQDQIETDQVRITGADVNHIRNVLRMRPGEHICVSNGQDAGYDCIITRIVPDQITADIVGRAEIDTELPARIWLFQGLPKGDKMELIIQKAVELGVHAIVPVAMKRSVVKLDEKKAESRRKRWQSISEGAAKQSGRTVIPQIEAVTGWKEAIRMAADMERKLLPYEQVSGVREAGKALGNCRAGERIAVLIGPEGGIDEEEAALARENGFVPISLGRRILRTETAGLCVLSLLMFHLEMRDGTDI